MNGYSGPLGPWETIVPKDGSKEYYHNHVTKVTTYDKPKDPKDEYEVCCLLISVPRLCY